MADVLAEVLGLFKWEVEDKELTEAEKKAKEAAQKVADKWRKAASSITSSLKVVAGAIAGAATAMGALANSVTESAQEIDTWSKRMGVSTRELQRLEYATKASGAEADNLRESVKTLRENLGEMERLGSGPAVDALNTLGISLEEIAGLGAEDQLALIADAMQGLSSDAERLSVAAELGGDDMSKLLALFDGGSGKMRKFGDEAERMGAVLSDEAIAQSVEFRQQLAQTTEELSALGKQIVADALPMIRKFVGGIREWLSENRQMLREKVSEWFDRLTKTITALLPVLESLAKIAAGVVDLIGTLADAIGPTGLIAAFTGARLAMTALGSGFTAFIPHIAAATAAVVALQLAFDALGAAQDRELEKLGRTTKIRGQAGGAHDAIDEARRKYGSGSVGLAQARKVAESRYSEADLEDAVDAAKNRRTRAELQKVLDSKRGARLAAEQTAGNAATAIGLAINVATAASEGKLKAPKKTGKGGRGGGKQEGLSEKEEAALARGQEAYGDLFANEASRTGATDLALQKAYIAAGESLIGGASDVVARGAGTGMLKQLTGDPTSDKGVDELLLDAVGLTRGTPKTAGGTAPVTGASFVRIDNSYNDNSTMTITVEGSGLSAEELEEKVWSKIEDRMDDARRRQYDRHKAQVMT